MSSKCFQCLLIVWISFTVFIFYGCTAIGYGVGAKVDASGKNRLMIPAQQLKQIKPGSKIKCVFPNGDIIRGEFAGLKQVDFKEFQQMFRDVLQIEPDFLAKKGDHIVIVDKHKNEIKGIFDEIGYESNGYVAIIPDGMDKPEKINLYFIKEIQDSVGNKTAAPRLVQILLKGNKIPGMTVLIVKTPRGEKNFPLYDLSSLEVKRNKGKFIGLLTGAAIDGFLIYYFGLSTHSL